MHEGNLVGQLDGSTSTPLWPTFTLRAMKDAIKREAAVLTALKFGPLEAEEPMAMAILLNEF